MAKYNKSLKKTERLHMLISPEEMASIDQWSEKAGIGSRSEAVRRLASLGLLLDEMSGDLATRYNALSTAYFEGSGAALKIIEIAGKDPETSLKAAVKALSDLAEPTADLGETVAFLTQFPAIARRSESFPEIAGVSDRVRGSLLDRLARLRAAFEDLEGSTK